MTVDEAIRNTQGKGAGFTLKGTVEYAQSLIKEKEKVAAAVSSTIYPVRGGHYPGIVVLTNHRVLAVCGIPGIRRIQSFPVKELMKIEEAESPLTYMAVFRTKDDSFRITLGPTTGRIFSKYVAKINARFDAAVNDSPADLASMSEKLDMWLGEAEKKGGVSPQDPLAVAARLAHELQEQ